MFARCDASVKFAENILERDQIKFLNENHFRIKAFQRWYSVVDKNIHRLHCLKPKRYWL